MLHTLLVLMAVVSLSTVVAPPDCLYIAYDCVYYIWNHGDGQGEALVTCDEGSTFSSYYGRFGECPD